jgi:hypothetical protein
MLYPEDDEIIDRSFKSIDGYVLDAISRGGLKLYLNVGAHALLVFTALIASS